MRNYMKVLHITVPVESLLTMAPFTEWLKFSDFLHQPGNQMLRSCFIGTW